MASAALYLRTNSCNPAYKFLYNEVREVVAEETSHGTITRYIRGLGIISSDSEEAKTYYHYVSDEQGSITHVLSEDAEILNHYSYDAFGNIIEKTEKVENRFCYNGEMLDPVTQQYYLRARFYNPVIGRFTQEDTYYGDGLNLYQYCQANPVGYVDPSGHNICPTQLSLYKKYKEFFAKKMPEAEAKKKAYEYMRKKMGLTADNPFTEISKGGTKATYSNSAAEKCNNRATEINKLRGDYENRMGTTAVMKAIDNETGQVVYLVSTNAPNKSVPKSLKDILRDNEIYIGGKGHAEQTIMNNKGTKYTVVAGGTSRNICKGICKPLLEADGLILGGPTFRGRDDKTSYRQFWRK